MKKTILTIVFALAFIVFASAQKVYTVTGDTIQGAETVNFTAIQSSSSSGTVAFQALCTELGGTSEGTFIWQGSVDGISFVTITQIDGKFDFYPNDTLTIADAAVQTLLVTGSPFNYYRGQGAGAASDTTLVSIVYSPKR